MGREVRRVPENFDWPIGRKIDIHDPPDGPWYQLWETTSEGSPISPAFEDPEDLARWLADTHASAMGGDDATYEQWLAFITGPGWAPSMVMIDGKIMSGVVGFDR